MVVTTPYHGYAKNLALAVTGRFDGHWVPLSDYGHIKFFSKRTLGMLARECGVEPTRWYRLGRNPAARRLDGDGRHGRGRPSGGGGEQRAGVGVALADALCRPAATSCSGS